MGHNVIKKICILILMAVFTGCEADEFFKSAARIDCYFESINPTAINGRLIIERATIHLQEIEISGIRSNASDVALNRNFNINSGKYNLFTNDPGQPLVLDIPQGLYDRLSFLLYLKQNNFELYIEREEDDDDDDDDEIEVELNDYLKNATPGFLLWGKYLHGNGKTYPFVLIVDDLIRINISARQRGSRQVILEESVLYTAFIRYNLNYWFGVISQNMMDAAEIAEVDDMDDDEDDYIIIHKNINQNLYANIVSRIEESTLFEID